MTLNKRKEAPLDPFKRAVTLATRSLAADGAMEVVFSTEPPGLTGKTARLPERALGHPCDARDRSIMSWILSWSGASRVALVRSIQFCCLARRRSSL